MKDELGGGLMKDFVALRRKTYSYFTVDVHGDVYYIFTWWLEGKGHKEVCHQMRNQILGLQKYVENNKMVLRFRRFRSEVQNVFAGKINKITLSANDDERIQTSDGVLAYPFGTGPIKLFKGKLVRYPKIKSWI